MKLFKQVLENMTVSSAGTKISIRMKHKQWVYINIANSNEIITLQPHIKLQGLRPEI